MALTTLNICKKCGRQWRESRRIKVEMQKHFAKTPEETLEVGGCSVCLEEELFKIMLPIVSNTAARLAELKKLSDEEEVHARRAEANNARL
jgi:hypothetical protein